MRAFTLAGPIAGAALSLVILSCGASSAAPDPLPTMTAPPLVPSGLSSATAIGLDSAPIAIDLEKFAAWRKEFRERAVAAGITRKTFDIALGAVAPNPSIILADQRQPETTRAIWDYLDGAVSDKRVARGQQALADNQAILTHIQRLYGVAPRFVVAIWGMESNYGSNTGTYNVFEALATLAFQGRRTSYAERELIAALKIADRGDKAPADMIGSWAGAMGQTQFIPSTYLAYAVDDDGDGHRDLFSSVPDVLASTANYLSKWEWRTGETWGEEVKVPASFDYSAADPTINLPLKRWRQLGIRTLKGARVPSSMRQSALFLPAGHRGPAFLLYDNFKTILRYNNSTSYGLAVGTLADRLKGAAPITHPWPREERPLTLDERKALQELLFRMGYQAGEADGILGGQSRLAIKAYQKVIGQPADGFATVDLLDRLRLDAEVAVSGGDAPAPPAPAPATSPAADPPVAPPR
jgi:membrane-bound lytic murein transglycosylase B